MCILHNYIAACKAEALFLFIFNLYMKCYNHINNNKFTTTTTKKITSQILHEIKTKTNT